PSRLRAAESWRLKRCFACSRFCPIAGLTSRQRRGREGSLAVPAFRAARGYRVQAVPSTANSEGLTKSSLLRWHRRPVGPAFRPVLTAPPRPPCAFASLAGQAHWDMSLLGSLLRGYERTLYGRAPMQCAAESTQSHTAAQCRRYAPASSR